MFQINKLIIENFLNHRNTVVPIANQGLVLVSGKNGSGKSALYEAIVWCLFGKTVRGSRVDHVVNDITGKDCKVTIEGSIYSKPILISRFRKHSVAGNDLVVVYDGKNLTGNASEIQRQLEELLRLDFNQFLLVSSFIPDRIKEFAAATPLQRSQVLQGILGLEKFDRAYELAHEELQKAEREALEVEKDLEHLQKNLDSLVNELNRLQREKAIRAEEVNEELENLYNERESIRRKLKKYTSPPEVKEISDELIQEAEMKAEQAEEEFRSLQTKLSVLESKMAELKEIKAENYIGSPCPICERPIDESHVESLRKHRRREMKKLFQEEVKLRSQLEKAEEEYKLRKDELNRLRALQVEYQHQLRTWQLEKESLEARIKQINEMLKHLRKKTDVYDDLIKRKSEEKKRLEIQVHNKKMELEVYNQDKILNKIVKDVFSKKGARQIFVVKVLSSLEEETKKILHKISSGRMDIRFEVTENLEIGISIFKDGKEKEYRDCSSGERHRVECALAFGINRMARKHHLMSTNFLFLDELLDRSLDAEGQETTFELLQDMIQNVSSLFVVSHRPELQSMFDKVWKIERGKVHIGG